MHAHDTGGNRRASQSEEHGVVEHDGTVKLGSLVVIDDGGLNEAWRIAVAHEADAAQWKLSEDAPLAQALFGHRAGERAGVRGPAGRRIVRIVRVDD
jgi:transcription elongation factor GreA